MTFDWSESGGVVRQSSPGVPVSMAVSWVAVADGEMKSISSSACAAKAASTSEEVDGPTTAVTPARASWSAAAAALPFDASQWINSTRRPSIPPP
jgi:hypothetical protein